MVLRKMTGQELEHCQNLGVRYFSLTLNIHFYQPVKYFFFIFLLDAVQLKEKFSSADNKGTQTYML